MNTVNLSLIGRVFYGASMTILGALTVYYREFPYMMIPRKHSWIPGLEVIACVYGALLIWAGASIIFKKNARTMSVLLGTLLLLVFCFYFIPYQLFVSSNNLVFGDWEDSAKELSLASGAFVIAGIFAEANEIPSVRFLGKLIPFGSVVFSITIISYSIDHFLYAEQAVDYVPSWIPYHLFWLYFGGVALLGSGLGIILKIKVRLIATLLGTMIFSWFAMLHVPRVIISSSADLGSEITSAFLALAYGGVAFVIADLEKSKSQ